MSERAAKAIEATRNSEDLVYFLMKRPEICAELFGDDATQRVGEISAQLMRNPPQAQQHRQQADPRPQELLQAHNERMMAMRKADPALAAAVDSAGQLPISQAVTMAVIEQENSQDLVIYFAKNPKVLEELNQLAPSAAMSRVGRIAAKLEGIEANSVSKRERVAPPAPISPVGGSSSRTGISLDDPAVPLREFFAVRNKQENARRRR